MENEKEMMAEEVKEVEETKEPYKVYDTKEAWQESIDAIIGSRLKDYRETKESLEQLTPLLEELKELSGAEEIGDIPQKLREKAKEKEVVPEEPEEIPKVKKPVEESAMSAKQGMRVKITPSKMTFKELDEISARVARGEKISF